MNSLSIFDIFENFIKNIKYKEVKFYKCKESYAFDDVCFVILETQPQVEYFAKKFKYDIKQNGIKSFLDDKGQKEWCTVTFNSTIVHFITQDKIEELKFEKLMLSVGNEVKVESK